MHAFLELLAGVFGAIAEAAWFALGFGAVIGAIVCAGLGYALAGTTGGWIGLILGLPVGYFVGGQVQSMIQASADKTGKSPSGMGFWIGLLALMIALATLGIVTR